LNKALWWQDKREADFDGRPEATTPVGKTRKISFFFKEWWNEKRRGKEKPEYNRGAYSDLGPAFERIAGQDSKAGRAGTAEPLKHD
jgi:hypothetical protein